MQGMHVLDVSLEQFLFTHVCASLGFTQSLVLDRLCRI